MKIFDSDADLFENTGLRAVIVTIPLEEEYIGTFYLSVPDDDYEPDLGEFYAIIDGLDLARERVEAIIASVTLGDDDEDNS